MSQKIIRIGSSNGVTLSSAVLKAAGLKKGEPVIVEFSEKSGAIEVRSARSEEQHRDLADARRLIRSHAKELSKLEAE